MSRKIFHTFFVLILIVGLVGIQAPQPVRAAGPWYVTTTGDDNNDCLSPTTPCATINGAIGKATAGDTINVAVGTFTGTGSEVVLIDKDITLSGGWDAGFTTQNGKSTIDGENVRQGIYIVNFVNNINVLLEYLIVQNGTSGISNNGQTLTLNNSIVSNNSGGGVRSGGILAINNSVISNNTDGDVGGGIEINGGTTTISNTVVKDNISSSYGGGIFNNGSTLNLNNSAVIGNIANNGGGTNGGGGIFHCFGCTLTISNSTISGNRALNAGGGGILNVGTLFTNNTTISNNTANDGGGLNMNSGTATLQNTIIAGNIANSAPDCSGTVGSSGYNIIGNTSGCTFTPNAGDQIDVNPQLGTYPIGFPSYHPLLAGSPAIDAGNPATCLATDQRGVSRPQGSVCDIGAYEYKTPGPGASFGISIGDNQKAAPLLAFASPLVIYVVDSSGSPVSGVTITFTAPVSGVSGTFANTGTNVTTASTNNSGAAVASTFTANSQSGNYNVIATASGLAGSVNFTLINAAWYVAPTGNDGNTCTTSAAPCLTINGAISKAAYGDTIKVATGTYTGSGTEVVLINNGVTLSGGWNPGFSTQSGTSTINAESLRRGITVRSGSVVIERFTIQYGSASDGGGILVDNNNNLTLINTIVIGNATDSSGGGISNYGSLTVNNSTISKNSAPNRNTASGGGIWNSGNLILNNSTVNGNTSAWNSGGIYNNGTATINHSSINNNKALIAGGVWNDGVYGSGILYINNSTISNNITNNVGGINNSSGGVANINNSTISNNSAIGENGGIGNYTDVANVKLENTILANNTASSTGPDCNRVTSLGHNLIGDTTNCDFTSGNGDLTNIDPKLGQLIGTSGLPSYHPLLAGSPAIDTGDSATCPDTDQRGVARPQGTTCDIGAYEFTTPGPAASLSGVAGDNQVTGISSAFPNPLQVAALDSQGSPVSGVTVDFSAPANGPSGTFADTGTNTTSAVTDEGGVATASVFTANDQAGTYTVSASAPGLGLVNFSLEQVARPVNDNFAGAKAIASLPFSDSGDNTQATTEPGEPQNCYSSPKTVWYSFTPTETLTLRADTQGSAINGNVNIYHAAGPGISDLQFLNCSGPSGSPTFTAEAGQKYYFQVGAAFGETGTVQFNLAEVSSITGHVTDAITNAPLPGNAPPFALATLYRVCGDGCLEFINSQNVDSEGRFLFDNYLGGPLPAGTYQIEVSANLYHTKQFGPFEFSGVSLDVGHLPITPLPTIGSISGRLVDAATGKPVSPTFTPSVQLYRCIDGNCFEFVNNQVPDSQGRFRFETDSSGNPLTVGTYQIVAYADQYQQAQTDPFEVGAGMHRTVGDLRITSFPVRFSDVQPCADIPASGGECAFSVKIWNGLPSKLKGDTWSVVNSALPDSFAGTTDFQAKDPQGLDLDRGRNKVLRFRFNVPPNGSFSGSSICTRVFVGQGNNSFFNTIGFRELFCVSRNAQGLTIASPQDVIGRVQANVSAVSTGTDVEPNNSCQAAQDLGAVPLPFALDGSLDSSQTPDVDFFRLTGIPGTVAAIDLEGQSTGKGTLGDPFLGSFDSNCNLIALNDDFNSLNSHLEITIPADGVFILGATTCCDSGFAGGGNGSYQLTVATIPVIGSISGRIVDAVSGKPLRGDVEPFAIVRLVQCGDFGCNDVNSQPTDGEGRFLFVNDFNGAPLRAGNYLVVASANQYQVVQTEQFVVGEGENYDAGNVALNSFPVRFSDIQTCSIPARGGVCTFSVKVTNGLSTQLSGRAWSMVNGSGIGSFTNFTDFQSDTPSDIRLNPGKSSVLHFRFRVPGSVANGATICTTVYVGQNPSALFHTVGLTSLFCFVKGEGGFALMSPQEAQAASQQMQIQELILQKQFEKKK